MTPIVLLALAFAAIIVLGTGAAWAHDVLEARIQAPARRPVRRRTHRPARRPLVGPARPGVARRRVGVSTTG